MDSIKMQYVESCFKWHTSLHAHCQMNGAFCPSVKDMVLDNITGNGWSKLQVGDEKSGRQSEMSNLVWKLLAHEDMLST